MTLDPRGRRRDGSVDYSIDSIPDRVRANRAELFPVITAAEEARKAARDGRAPRFVACRWCRRTIHAGKPCWWCDVARGARW